MFSVANWMSSGAFLSLRELNERIILRQFFRGRYGVGKRGWDHALWSNEVRRIAEYSFSVPILNIPDVHERSDSDDDTE